MCYGEGLNFWQKLISTTLVNCCYYGKVNHNTLVTSWSSWLIDPVLGTSSHYIQRQELVYLPPPSPLLPSCRSAVLHQWCTGRRRVHWHMPAFRRKRDQKYGRWSSEICWHFLVFWWTKYTVWQDFSMIVFKSLSIECLLQTDFTLTRPCACWA